MPGVPDHFLQIILALPTRFTKEDVKKAAPELQDKTVAVYLSNLASEGVLERVAPNTFLRTESQETQELRPELQPVVRDLEGRLLPSLLQRLVVWGDQDLGLFTHDAIMQPFLVVEGPPQAQDTLRGLLQEQWDVHPVRWRARLGEEIWKRDPKRGQTTVFLTTNSDLLGTKPAEGGVRVPRVERLFVDALKISALMPDTAFQMLSIPSFDVQLAIRIAGARSETGPVASFLTWAAMLHPDKKVSRDVRNTFVHMKWSEGRSA